jgi:hypothetical protein
LQLVKKKTLANHTLSNKLTPKFEGPFQVIEQLSDLNYKIKKPGTNPTVITAHVCHLEPYYSRTGDGLDGGSELGESHYLSMF